MTIIVFDLDDTLYSYESFLKMGFKNVSKYLSEILNYPENQIYKKIFKFHKKNNRKVFDNLVIDLKIKRKYIKKCIYIFRYSNRKIKLFKDVKNYLYNNKKFYLITDGNKLVQKNKGKLLKIKPFFKKIYYTNEYAIKFNKPSLHCFNKIKKLENCDYSDMIYVGDNPFKDFFNCNKVGIKTIRVMRGVYKKILVSKPYDAKIKIKNISELKKFI